MTKVRPNAVPNCRAAFGGLRTRQADWHIGAMENAKINSRSFRDRAKASAREIALAMALTVGALVFLMGAVGQTG
jgi:hypothetical protein